MAEINIEKKSSPIWPWIVLLVLIIAGAIWYFYERSDDDSLINEDIEQYEDEPRTNDNDLTP